MIMGIINGDALKVLKKLNSESIDCCITSPPYYGLRDYGVDGQLGQEATPTEYIHKLVDIFKEVYRVLRPTGTLWVVMGDSYCGTRSKGTYKDFKHAQGRNGQVASITEHVDNCKRKDLIGIPWMFAFAMRDAGWYLRQDIIWHKPNPFPESVKDRCTKSHEYVFLFSKSEFYYYDHNAIKEPTIYPTGSRPDKKRGDFKGKYHAHEDIKHLSGTFRTIRDFKNKRDVWTVCVKPFKGNHFATFPPDLIEPCVLAGCPINGIVLDPFLGSGTTALVALNNNREFIGIELNKEYCQIAENRLNKFYANFENKEMRKIANDN